MPRPGSRALGATGHRTTPALNRTRWGLHLVESQRVRRLALGALGASVAVHAASVGVAAAPGATRDVPAGGGPISVRFLLPPDRVQAPVGERIAWVRLGPGTTGLVDGRDPGASLERAPDTHALAESTRPPDSAAEGNQTAPTAIYTEEEVDSVAVRDPASDGPAYPEALRAGGVQGLALVEFTVDSAGRADTESFHVVEATDPQFAAAVREALPRMRFRPAVVHGRRVSQVVRLPMRFRLLSSDNGSTS